VPPRYPKSTTTPIALCCLRHRLSGHLQHQEMRAPLAVNRRKRSPGMGNPMDKTDVGRNITNVHSNSDKMAHWINAQRHDPDLKAEVFSRRAVSSLESVTLHPPQRWNWSSSSLTTSQPFPGVSSSFYHPRLIIFLVDASFASTWTSTTCLLSRHRWRHASALRSTWPVSSITSRLFTVRRRGYATSRLYRIGFPSLRRSYLLRCQIPRKAPIRSPSS
jgi:hypothetical protein